MRRGSGTLRWEKREWSRESRRGITKEGYQSRENGGEMVEIGISRVEHGGGKRG